MRATALPGNMYFLGGGGQIKTRILGEQVTQLFGGGAAYTSGEGEEGELSRPNGSITCRPRADL